MMNRMFYAGVAVMVLAVMTACEKGKTIEKDVQVSLVTSADTVSYIIGTDIANSLKMVKDEVVSDILFAAIKDGLAGKASRIAPEQQQIIMQAFSTRMQEKQMAKTDGQAAENLAEATKFLTENGKKPGVVTTASGLQYTVITEGKGPIPADTAKVTVHYEGTLLSGKVFDSSIKRGQPAVFGVNQVIKGWTEALKLMKVGSKYKLFVPPELAYGRRGMPHDIGPNVMLIFDVELISIEK